jgi:uncharacterized membrane protein (UPF0182 family)
MVVPGGTNNLAAFMSVNSDFGPNYGKITVLEVPTQNNIDGPSQIGNLFTSEPVISKDISLLGGGQSSVLHGNLLTLPVGDSFLYVEPLYVQGTGGTSSFPTLQRVLVTYGNNKGYGETLEAALEDLQTKCCVGASIEAGQTGSTGSTNTPPPTQPSGSPTNERELLQSLADARAALNSAYDSHDQVAIARAQARLDTLVQELLDLKSVAPATGGSSGSSSGSSSSSAPSPQPSG